MSLTILSILGLLFFISITVYKLLKKVRTPEDEKDMNTFSLIIGHIAIITLITVPILLITFLFYLMFKGINSAFSNLITFDNIGTLVITSVFLIIFLTFNSFITYPLLNMFIYAITKNKNNLLNTILYITFRVLIDTIGIYLILNNNSKITLNSLVIPIAISIFFILIDYFLNNINQLKKENINNNSK
ncbi:hypothetical protein [Bacillus cereus]|uniref:hypothetical protein n=1 Tax=Bacillus cereus TaxID=1396 RepID=UPI0018794801|nr:hypothetical protein [Bacillus cereus]MBE7121978.1 hypothetical protein [Bacillus cereus]